jgi:uncharacterized pyridoxamine 5'-phosphate oxidase family protein
MGPKPKLYVLIVSKTKRHILTGSKKKCYVLIGSKTKRYILTGSKKKCYVLIGSKTKRYKLTGSKTTQSVLIRNKVSHKDTRQVKRSLRYLLIDMLLFHYHKLILIIIIIVITLFLSYSLQLIFKGRGLMTKHFLVIILLNAPEHIWHTVSATSFCLRIYEPERRLTGLNMSFSVFDTTLILYNTNGTVQTGDSGGTVVKLLCYKSEGSWFDPSWCHKFLLIALWSWGRLSL